MNGDDTRSGDWSKWRNLVLFELDELTKAVKHITEQQTEFTADIRVLQVKAGLSGGAGGIGVLLISKFVAGA